MWVKREIEALLLRRASTHPVVVLTGARQTGKTSLLRRLFPDHAFVALDLPSEAERAERDPMSFFARHAPPVIIDEAQYAPSLFSHLKDVVERDGERAGAILLVGSHLSALAGSLSDTLVGQAAVIELEPLSYAEARRAYPQLTVEEFLLRGGFPELYRDLQVDSEDFLRSYVATYLVRELPQLLNVSSLRDFERFLRAAALRTAQLLNRADLAREAGISGSTAAAWLAALESSHQLALLKPWCANAMHATVKRPKLYLRDAGVAAFLCGVTSIEGLRASPLAEALWETMVCAELRRFQEGRLGRWAFNFWRDRTREADFLFRRRGSYLLADAKWTEHPDARDADTLTRVGSELSEEAVSTKSIFCRTPNAYSIGTSDVRALPLAGPATRDWAPTDCSHRKPRGTASCCCSPRPG